MRGISELGERGSEKAGGGGKEAGGDHFNVNMNYKTITTATATNEQPTTNTPPQP